MINDIELLGRVLDGNATDKERKTVFCNLSDAAFEEFFMVALRATILFNEKNEIYDEIQ